MSLLRCILVLVIACLLPVSALPQASEAEGHLNRGLDLAHAGKLDESESELKRAANLAPRDPEILTALGSVLAMQQKLQESTDWFKQALLVRPSDLTTRRYLAANLWQLHRYAEAAENLKIILKQTPDDQGSRLLLGMVAENTGDYVTSARMLASVPAEVQKQPQSIAALARSYYHLGQIEKARSTLAQLSSHPFGPQAVFLGGQIADGMQDYETAEKLFTSIRPAFPDRVRLDYNLALVAYHSGQIAKSLALLEPLAESENRTAPTLNLLGWCYQMQGEHARAVQLVQQAMMLAPDEETNYLDLVKIQVAQHELPAARRAAVRATDKFPNSAAAFELRGLTEKEMGQFTDAMGSYTRASELDPDRPNAILGLAKAQSAAGLNKEASANFQLGMKKFPKDASLQAAFAEMLLAESETGNSSAATRAEQLLHSALALDPNLADAHYQLGNLALANDALTDAQQHLETAVKLDPNHGRYHFALARVYRRQNRKPDADHEMDLYEKLRTHSPSNN